MTPEESLLVLVEKQRAALELGIIATVNTAQTASLLFMMHGRVWIRRLDRLHESEKAAGRDFVPTAALRAPLARRASLWNYRASMLSLWFACGSPCVAIIQAVIAWSEDQTGMAIYHIATGAFLGWLGLVTARFQRGSAIALKDIANICEYSAELSAATGQPNS